MPMDRDNIMLRFQKLWETLSDKEKVFIQQWLSWTGNQELLTVLEIIDQKKLVQLSKYKNPYNVVRRLFKFVVIALVFIRNNRLLPQFQILLDIMGSYILLETGLKEQGEEYMLDAFYKAKLQGLALTTAYVGTSIMGLELPHLDINQWRDIYEKVRDALNAQQMATVNMYVKVIVSIYKGESKKPVHSLNELPDVIREPVQEMIDKQRELEQVSPSYPIIAYTYLITIYDVYFYLLSEYQSALEVFEKLKPIAINYIRKGMPNFVDEEHALTRAMAARRIEQGIVLGKEKFIKEGIDSLRKITSSKKHDYFRFMYLSGVLFYNILKQKGDEEIKSTYKIIKRRYKPIGSIRLYFTKCEFWHLYYLLLRGDSRKAVSQIRKLEQTYKDVIDRFPFNYALLLSKVWIDNLKEDSLEAKKNVQKIEKLHGELYPDVDIENFLKALLNDRTTSAHKIEQELIEWFRTCPSVAEIFSLINPLTRIFNLNPQVAHTRISVLLRLFDVNSL
ncbi:MAG: hypothetical protein GXO48_06070 [Chlorobi bacterium]|nr:hypothetical protein [Chlorobiota bacterium]